jgi:hypothetical protein
MTSAGQGADRPIVAELGRQETPEEMAARKAENSRKHRANQTTRNLVASLAASLLVVAFLIFVVARPDSSLLDTVDYAAVAAEANLPNGTALAPVLPPSWEANAAEIRESGGVTVWYIGFLTPDGQFIALEQGFDANETWLASHLPNPATAGQQSTDGVDWSTSTSTESNVGNNATVWTHADGPDDIVLYGTASDSEFFILATAIAAEVTR